MIKKTISLSMLIFVLLFMTLISFFHYNQLPIYDWGLAYKFIKNSTQTENFEILSKNLGFSSDEKLLIIHADDLGLSDSVNDTSMESLLKNTVTSASVIMNAEKVQEIADFSKKYPKIDLGVHLTVTSEWKFHKWGGILSNNDIDTIPVLITSWEGDNKSEQLKNWLEIRIGSNPAPEPAVVATPTDPAPTVNDPSVICPCCTISFSVFSKSLAVTARRY